MFGNERDQPQGVYVQRDSQCFNRIRDLYAKRDMFRDGLYERDGDSNEQLQGELCGDDRRPGRGRSAGQVYRDGFESWQHEYSRDLRPERDLHGIVQ